MATREEINAFMLSAFPQSKCGVENVGPRSARVRYKVDFDALRPGGTVSGPVLFTVADCAIYVAILAEFGLVALAVTTSLNINFLRKPVADRDVIGECRLLKVGKSLVVGEVFIFSEGDDEPVAHATGTYSIPPNRSGSAERAAS